MKVHAFPKSHSLRKENLFALPNCPVLICTVSVAGLLGVGRKGGQVDMAGD